MMNVTVKIRMMEGCEELAPAKAHHDDAAFDIRSRVDMELPPGQTVLVPTGIFMEFPAGYEAQIRPRSGMSLKHSLLLVNSPGTIDAGYRGEVGIIMHNLKKEPFQVHRGDRIAQMVICKLPEVTMELVNDLADSHRGEGGFGSTGHR
jgi:dUTP pyrophosphatase